MKILVVDREEQLGGVLQILAQTPGNEVQKANTGDEALALMEGQHLDLLITEVFLEPMNGFTLRNKMENRHGGVRTIFLTGYDLTPYAEYTAGYEVVPKPATPQKLFPAIARALGAGAAAPEPVPQAAAPVEQPDAAPAPAVAPVASPAAVPRAVPTPTAVPRAVPAPAATPTPTATPVAVPRATPAAVPRLAATPVATPRATPAAATPGAVPKVSATPSAVPKFSAPGVKAVPKPGVAAAKPVARHIVVTDPLLGQNLGSYKIETKLGKGKWGPVYKAIQTSMNRPVAMEMLAPELAGDEHSRQEFVATARAKAAVQHPHILSVYEADQAGGNYFYTHEFVDGSTLAQMADRGEGLSEPLALQTIKYVAQALAHLHHNNISHSMPDATDIFIGTDGLPYLSNVALPGGEEMPEVRDDMYSLGAIVRSLLPGGQAQDRGLQAMLTRMAMNSDMGFQSWQSLFQAIQAIEPKVIPADAFKLSAQDAAAIRAVEQARKRQKMQVAASIAGLFVFLWVVAFGVWYEFMRPTYHDYSDDMVRIDAGDFIYQDGQKVSLPEFYIDKYEVTIGEYEKFLEYLKAHQDTTMFDSPLQPEGRSHIPHDWDIYYGRASSNFSGYRTVKGVPITLDCPVFNVDYFDAYAYAKWKNRRLPTEKEWEKAARGPAGNLYPWGNEWDPTKLNAGGDYSAEPPDGYKPAVDGYNWWAPVTAFLQDKSPYGVMDMAGNVSEWTDSWDASKTYVVIRGGNFKSSSEKALATNSIKAYPQQTAETLGFRTASDTAPGK